MQYSTYGQRYHFDLQIKWNCFDFIQFETLFFRILKNQYLT